MLAAWVNPDAALLYPAGEAGADTAVGAGAGVEQSAYLTDGSLLPDGGAPAAKSPLPLLIVGAFGVLLLAGL